MRGAVGATLAAVMVAAGCGNFFPNPDNVALPSGLGDVTLTCGTLPRGECEARAARLVAEKRIQQPGARIVKIQLLDKDGSYTITFADGTGETMIVN